MTKCDLPKIKNQILSGLQHRHMSRFHLLEPDAWPTSGLFPARTLSFLTKVLQCKLFCTFSSPLPPQLVEHTPLHSAILFVSAFFHSTN